MGMYDFINKIYGDSYDRELNKSWRTNDSVSLVQNYLNSIGHSNIKEDGFSPEYYKSQKPVPLIRHLRRVRHADEQVVELEQKLEEVAEGKYKIKFSW